MLAYTTCLRRAIKPTVCSGSLPMAPRILQYSLSMRQLQRPYSTVPEPREALASQPRTAVSRSRQRKDTSNTKFGRSATFAGKEKLKAALMEEEEDAVVSKDEFVETINRPEEPSEAAKRERKKLEWAVNKQLEYTTNEYNIAKHVEATLRKGRFDEALLFAQRASSQNSSCVVAWNHLIDYEISKKNRLNAGMKLLNDMKKRGQKPNEQTYTVIFRGCAKAVDTQAAVKKAVHLYNSLLEDERVKVNSIHLNAVLEVCGRAGDIDSMFAIASTVDEKAGRKADAFTYTTILNSLRAKHASSQQQSKIDAPSGPPPTAQAGAGQAEAVQETIARCSTIWEETISEWRNRKLWIDEGLVCAMGRVLLLGNQQDRSKIFALLEDTMSIPDYTQWEDTEATKKHIETLNEGMRDIVVNKKKKKVPGLKNVTYAVPGQHTLSLILAAINTESNTAHKTRLTQQYTKSFEFYGLKPDSNNYEHFLRLRERDGASAAAVRTIGKIPPQDVTPQIIRVGLQTCLRDNMNHAAFDNATAILGLMTSSSETVRQQTGRTPKIDLRALQLYHRVAVAANYHFRQMTDKEEAKRAHHRQLASAVNHLYPLFLAAKKALQGMVRSAAKDRPSTVPWLTRRADFERDLLDVARKIVAEISRIQDAGTLEGEELAELRKKQSHVNRLVVEFTDPGQRGPSKTPEAEEPREMPPGYIRTTFKPREKRAPRVRTRE